MTSNFVKFAQHNFPLPISTSQFTHFGAHVNSMELRMSCDVKELGANELRCQGAAMSRSCDVKELRSVSCNHLQAAYTSWNHPRISPASCIYYIILSPFIISQNELKVNSCGAHFSIHKKFSITIDFFSKL